MILRNAPEYIPQIFTQDALRVARTGRVCSLLDRVTLMNDVFDREGQNLRFFVNPSELTPKGLRVAVERYRKNRMERYIDKEKNGDLPLGIENSNYYYDVSFESVNGLTLTKSDRPVDPKDQYKPYKGSDYVAVRLDYLRPAIEAAVRQFIESFLHEIETHPEEFIERAKAGNTYQIPALRESDKLIAKLQQTIDEHLSPRLKRFGEAESPTIIISENSEFLDPYKKNNPNIHGIYFQRGDELISFLDPILIKPDYVSSAGVITEEMEHALNYTVGFDSKKWSEAATKDFKSDVSFDFMKKYSNKDTLYTTIPSWTARYHVDDFADETLVELNLT